MGLFDLFGKKQKSESAQPVQVKEPYLGDLEKTQTIFELIDVPGENRDEQWQETFLENIA